jgi:hypothetical protein
MLHVSQSEYIDCPCGDINIILKSISSENNKLYTDDVTIELELISLVSKDKITIPTGIQEDSIST